MMVYFVSKCCIFFLKTLSVWCLCLKYIFLNTNSCQLQLVSRYIRRGQLNNGFPLFETESLKYPGFVEFDDVNGKVLTFSAQDG
jgi:hypothetical protein